MVPKITADLIKEKFTARFSTDTLNLIITLIIGLHVQFSVQDRKEVTVSKAIIMTL